MTATFFAELADVLDRLSTFVDPLVLAGDVNLRLERTSDTRTVKFCDLVAGYGLVQQVRCPTHDAGGTLDVVCTRGDLPAPTVDVSDVGLSDHHLLRWSSRRLLRPPPAYVTSTRRSWRSFDLDIFSHRPAGVGAGMDLTVTVLCSCMMIQSLHFLIDVLLYDLSPSSVTAATVCLECRRTLGVLDEEV